MLYINLYSDIDYYIFLKIHQLPAAIAERQNGCLERSGPRFDPRRRGPVSTELL